MRSDVQVPDGWQVVRLEDVAKVKSGTGFPLDRQGRRNGTYPFIKVSDMNLKGNETYITSANNYVDPHDAEDLRANIFTPGTIVFPKVGAAIATNKKRALSVPTVIDNNMVGVTVSDIDKCDARFLHSWFEFVDLNTFANVSAVPSITGSRLKRVLIPLPPLTEQRAIAGVLDAIDEATERTEAVIAATERLRDSLLHELLTRGVPGSNVKTLADAPLEIIDGDRGKNYPKQRDFSESGHCLFLNTANVTTAGFSFSSRAFISSDRDQRLGKGKLFRDDVVLTTRGTVGNSAHFDGSVSYDNLRINSGMVILRPSKHDLYPGYLYAFVRSQVFLSQVSAFRTGSAQPQLPIRVMQRIKIALPPLCEQRAIAGALGAIDAAIVARASELDRLQATKASTSDALLTGRLRTIAKEGTHA